ncbi:MAG TPA: hypothetical protein VLU95_08100 [Candidatus Acidoferrum sp.]|nr:hypothetical protein [Candidatus Acidoferrum sp.]
MMRYKTEKKEKKKEKAKMSSIEQLIAKKIQKISPTLETQGSDKRVLQLAYKDFANYMKFSNKSFYSINFDEKIETISKSDLPELDSFLTIWTGWWITKWQQRVKLFIGNNSTKDLKGLKQTYSKAEPLWKNLDCKQELLDMVKSMLINNGEICGADMLAEYAVKMELTKNKLDLKEKQQALTFVNNVTHRVHAIAKTTGPLMFVEVTKSYYGSLQAQTQ